MDGNLPSSGKSDGKKLWQISVHFLDELDFSFSSKEKFNFKF
jgi:hypothetical protein